MGVFPWVTFSAAPLYLMPEGFHACLHSRQGGFRWSCVGKRLFPFFWLLGFINHLSHREKSGWKASQTNFTTGVQGSLHTYQFLTRLESLGVKNRNTREAIRNRTVQKTLSMSDMILKFFFIALNSKTDWTLQNLPTEIVNKNMERFNLHLQPPRLRPDRTVEPKARGSANRHKSHTHLCI